MIGGRPSTNKAHEYVAIWATRGERTAKKGAAGFGNGS